MGFLTEARGVMPEYRRRNDAVLARIEGVRKVLNMPTQSEEANELDAIAEELQSMFDSFEEFADKWGLGDKPRQNPVEWLLNYGKKKEGDT